MPADPTDLLERANPERVPDLDYDRLARAGRRRRRTYQAGTAIAVVGILAAGVVTAVELRQPAGLEVIGNGPGAQPADDPVGSWSQTAELDGGRNGAFAQTTDEGQLVIYGGTEGIDGQPARDGRVVDLADGSTTTISAPPVATRPYPFVALAEQRLLVFGGNDGRADGAYYDLAQSSWTVIPEAPSDSIAPNVRYWDGSTLIVGDSFRMSDRSVGNPQLWQWQAGQDAWTALPDSPLDPGTVHASAGQGQLAVWTDPMVDDPDSGLDVPEYAADATSGQTRLAVYDLAAEAWSAIPRQDLPTLRENGRARIGWMNEELVAVPMPPMNPVRESHDDRGDAVELASPVAYTPETWQPRTLDPMPIELQRDTLEVGIGDGSPVLTPTRAPITAAVGRIAAALTDDGTWTDPVTASQIRRVGHDLVAIDTPWIRDTPLTATVWHDGSWQPATNPDAPARGFAAAATTNEAIYLVGGSTMRTPEPGEEPDGNPSEDGSNGPYIIDTHHNIIRYTPTR